MIVAVVSTVLAQKNLDVDADFVRLFRCQIILTKAHRLWSRNFDKKAFNENLVPVKEQGSDEV